MRTTTNCGSEGLSSLHILILQAHTTRTTICKDSPCLRKTKRREKKQADDILGTPIIDATIPKYNFTKKCKALAKYQKGVGQRTFEGQFLVDSARAIKRLGTHSRKTAISLTVRRQLRHLS